MLMSPSFMVILRAQSLLSSYKVMINLFRLKKDELLFHFQDFFYTLFHW